MTDYQLLSDDELGAIRAEVEAELSRRARARSREQDINRLLLDGMTSPEGHSWVRPSGAHDAYPLNWEVSHGGKRWVSLVLGNVWEPGESGWREVVVAPGPGETPTRPAWVQPTGAHDAYPIGAEVGYGGQFWRSSIGANVWAPGVYGWATFTI